MSSTSLFAIGEHKIKSVEPDEKFTPKPLLIFTPVEAGEFPVLVLLHGYLLNNSFYSQLSHQIASHGFILIVPLVSSHSFY
ncbi:putative chlorophyllase [Helianthus annuus]|nr:putative chlorophyllase [Helianthus annuus]KAJ0634652.1 putative chlorophyllase [Helianthus annuus]KAJ0811258.1 putative chlorophyllase [Helianthus annuus]